LDQQWRFGWTKSKTTWALCVSRAIQYEWSAIATELVRGTQCLLQIDRAVANVTQVRSYPQIIPQGRHIHPFGRRRTCEHRTFGSV